MSHVSESVHTWTSPESCHTWVSQFTHERVLSVFSKRGGGVAEAEWCTRFLRTCSQPAGVKWRRCIRCLSCRSLSAKEPLIVELFCGKWPLKMKQPMDVRHPVFLSHVTCEWVMAHMKKSWHMKMIHYSELVLHWGMFVHIHMRWLRLVGSIKHRSLLQKSPIKLTIFCERDLAF